MSLLPRWLWWAVLVAVLLAALPVLVYLAAPQILTVERLTARADVIVVLGGETPNRAARAAELFHRDVARHILVSGAGDAGLIRRRLLDQGVPASAISLEENSANTWENGVFSVRMLRRANARKVCLVTSWYHSRRSVAAVPPWRAPAVHRWR